MFDTETYNAIVRVAQNNNIEAAKLLAVTQVESAGTPFWTVNGKKVPVIRFEGHYFYRLLKNTAQRNAAVKQGLASPVAGAVKNPTSAAARYDLLARARKINADAANQSVSWGVGQVMGEHWSNLGYKSVQDLVNSASDSIEGQVDLMLRFIVKNGLLDELNGKKWAAFARGYNGPAYKKYKYDTQLATAYAKFAKAKTATAAKQADVKIVQKQLKTLGLYSSEIDGDLGDQTAEAISTFQETNGLVVDGEVGSITANQLTKVVAEKKDEEFKAALPAAGAIVTGGSSVVGALVSNSTGLIDTIKSANDSTDAVTNLLHNIGLNSTSVIFTVVIAVVAAFTIYLSLRRK